MPGIIAWCSTGSRHGSPTYLSPNPNPRSPLKHSSSAAPYLLLHACVTEKREGSGACTSRLGVCVPLTPAWCSVRAVAERPRA